MNAITLRGTLNSANIAGQIKIGNFGGELREYEGEYVVEPNFEEQTLETQNKALRQKIAVAAIKVEYTDNAAGGKTVTIGSV